MTWEDVKYFKGEIYIRPCGYGWCAVNPGGMADLEEYLGLAAGHYDVEIAITPKDKQA